MLNSFDFFIRGSNGDHLAAETHSLNGEMRIFPGFLEPNNGWFDYCFASE